MAKKGTRVQIGLVCSVCRRQNYTTEKNKVNTASGLKINKYCPRCKKRTTHKENKKLD
ncbi:50S ribosomal protein L33 [Patescibacteria group bacterium]|nr:50S ribosomal protein L33 [Patescibacteria group bacterium]MCL5091689.1 50S ribosomal protein L33 [Patescibacteria group bacterium]